MKWTHALYPSSQANLSSKIINQIGIMIAGDDAFSQDCSYFVEFDTPAPGKSNLHRIYVAFADGEHLAIFQSKKTVDVIVNGVKNIFQISQPGIQWGENLADSSIRVFLKKLPKGVSKVGFMRALDKLKFGTARPMVKEAKDARHMTHKGGVVESAMVFVTTVPHDDDPECTEVLPLVRISLGRGVGSSIVVTLTLGCSKHFCNICLKHGHLEKVHEKFADRSTGGKRKASGGLIRNAKRRLVAPASELLKGVVQDP